MKKSMPSFIYTYAEHTPRGGHTQKSVAIYRVKRNVPQLVAKATDSFVSEFQLVMQTLEAGKLLPEAAFERGVCHNYVHGAAYLLFEAGFARINKVI